MAILTKAPRGTQDVLPDESGKWQHVERAVLSVAELYGYKEIRFPTFEHTELFARGVGDSTDVVEKEMYTFTDKGGRSLTLRPEGTSGAMRAVIEHGLLGGALPLKLSYLTSCFRYEKPQAGRLREFHQFGVECIGTETAAADAEVIALASQIFSELGAEGLRLEINSIGCPECRGRYHEALKAYFTERKDRLCETCLTRLDRNPMRILDCKCPLCKETAEGAPTILEFLCGDCEAHFEDLKARLSAMGIGYAVNPGIVRGLDYYTRTVFEFVSTQIGAQGTVCGGGRYDGLVEMLGGSPAPGIGFGLGIERLLLVMEASGADFPPAPPVDIYIGSVGQKAGIEAAKLCAGLRAEGFYAACDLNGRSVKAQMKYADKLGAAFSCILGDNELAAGEASVKNMKDGVEEKVKFENLIDHLYNTRIDGLCEALENI
ncbi:MAG TPA: histidine--tRNA ligase [Oscillospiraceae bacterium]|nr:histidine--tRNA ligase [Oscillospiraceae bacterium]HPW00201.1 histidine--tRNA ligase [Oscillospiraceae bacterium]